jgi:uncharacterized protein YaaR (DUF327 family)
MTDEARLKKYETDLDDAIKKRSKYKSGSKAYLKHNAKASYCRQKSLDIRSRTKKTTVLKMTQEKVAMSTQTTLETEISKMLDYALKSIDEGDIFLAKQLIILCKNALVTKLFL